MRGANSKVINRGSINTRGRKHTSGVVDPSTHLFCKQIRAAADAWYVRKFGRKGPEVSHYMIGAFAILPDDERLK